MGEAREAGLVTAEAGLVTAEAGLRRTAWEACP